MGEQAKKTNDAPAINYYPALAPRVWHGMITRVWWRLMFRNRCRVSWSRLHRAIALAFFTPINDVLGFCQHLIHGRAIRRTELAGPPIFVLGHWRSGTTLMHEILHLDDRFTSPSTFQCFAPWHFLLTEPWMLRFGNFLVPEKRPMDNMEAGWTYPQEDEFALMVLGAPTPYYWIAFPHHPVPHLDSLSTGSFHDQDLKVWKSCMDWFFRALTYHTGKPLIIKSPPHTGRLGILVEMFPDAKFIHMVRDPRKLYPSTLKLWTALCETQGMQAGMDQERLRRYVNDAQHRMYDAFEVDRQGLGPDRIIDVRYEDLTSNFDETIAKIYRQLELGDCQPVVEKFHQKQDSKAEYQPNRHAIDDEVEKIVQREWSNYARRYGYL
jgi:omega-hydroxy-beta-dihydromenaquinone-9 sulfotransferase